MKKQPFFSHFKYKGGYWFRILGYGLAFKDIRKHSLLFSERNGYAKNIIIGYISIKILVP